MADAQDHQSAPPPDMHARRQGLPPDSEHWHHAPHRAYTAPTDYDVPPYEELSGAGHGQENSELVRAPSCSSP